MIFDQDKLEPTYVLSMGIPGSSYGIELAQKFSFPKSVIHAAKAALGTKHFELNHLIEKQKLQYMKLQGICDKHEKLHQELKRMEKQARAAYRLFEEQRENYLHRAYDNALKELHKFRKKWEPVLSDSAQPESETHSVAVKDAETSSSFMEEFSGKQKKFARKREVYRERQSLECGDTVEVFSYNKQGVLVDFSANGAKARVRLGNLDITVPVSELRRIGAAPATTSIPKVRGKGYSVQMSAPGNDSLNLLGEKIDDALITLENYLDSTAIAGYKSVQIVCGKGKLKDAILSVVSRHVLTAGKKIEFPNDGTVRIFLES
jgi:DNA mismatch repair protein MutS2